MEDFNTENTFEYYNGLGFHSPYYTRENDNIKVSKNFATGLEKLKEKVLNISSVVEILSRGYIYGDKTLVRDLYKAPWMGKPNSSYTDWNYFDIPNHGEIVKSTSEVADSLFQLLKEEILGYISHFKSVGILLTGGMDSRIVACAVREIQRETGIDVKCYTWGDERSRDVIYAKRIADHYGWLWNHLIVDASQMIENLNIVVNYGAEFSPIHLHAMPILKNKANEVDCFLAASFGDSIGRAEYSGTWVQNLTSHEVLKNYFSLVRSPLFNDSLQESILELNRYHRLFPQKEIYQQYEQDYQLHYMRRMLNACMSIVNEDIPLFQAFSSPKVFGYMWSLSPSVRNNEIYKNILQKIDHELLDIPWARTGLRYPEKQGIPDQYLKMHHQYGELIRKNILPKYQDILFSDKLERLNLFNTGVLKKIYNLCINKPIRNGYSHEGKLLWIISLILACEKYKISSISQVTENIEYRHYCRDIFYYNLRYYHNRMLSS